jgi:hypothetical protein
MDRIVQSKGGQTRAIQQRDEALQKYYSAPNFCKNCNKVIMVPDGIQVAIIKRKFFCNHSCAASYRNRNYTKQQLQICANEDCCQEFYATPARNRKFCSRMCGELANKLPDMTKAELKKQKGSWLLSRSYIQSNALRIYQKSNVDKKCIICGYSKHVEAAHIRKVASFLDSAKISEINALSNLMGLCPTHHWEFDNNALDVESMSLLLSLGVIPDNMF